MRLDPLLTYNFVDRACSTASSTLAIARVAAAAAVSRRRCSAASPSAAGSRCRSRSRSYKEGGRNGTVLKFPTRVDLAPIVLKRGIGAGTALWDWHYGFVEGTGKRRDGVIVLLDDLHLPGTHLVLPPRPAGEVHWPVAERAARARSRSRRSRSRTRGSGRCRSSARRGSAWPRARRRAGRSDDGRPDRARSSAPCGAVDGDGAARADALAQIVRAVLRARRASARSTRDARAGRAARSSAGVTPTTGARSR